MNTTRTTVLAVAVSIATALSSINRAGSRVISNAGDCKAGVCGGMAHYPVSPGMRFYSTFNVPGLPLNQSAIENDITYYIYANIFFEGGECKDCAMNQFVNQLMLGDVLFGSSGSPSYDPVFGSFTTWIFAAQYFMVRTCPRRQA